MSVLLSSGSFPWLEIKNIVKLAKECGFHGIELVPTRKIISDIENFSHFDKSIKSLHESWRLDIGYDKEYGINYLTSMFFIMLRFIFFPSVNKTKKILGILSEKYNLPVTVHDINEKWVLNHKEREFFGGIQYEILGIKNTAKTLQSWLKKKNHTVVIDTRNDQSLLWAKKYGFFDWKEFWTWIGLDKIKNLQLTLIGKKGINDIRSHKNSQIEEQLLWLYRKKWKGTVVVEVNPLSLLLKYKGDLKNGLTELTLFVQTTLIKGQKWS